MAKYIKALPAAPASDGYVAKIHDWGMMLNDTLGCCTVACAGHEILQWSTYSGHPFRVTDAEVLAAYESPQVGSYVPGDPSTDNGAVILDVLNYWRKTGIGGHKIAAFVAVNWRNHEEVKQAIALLGNVYIGIQLPLSAQQPTVGGNGNLVWRCPPTQTGNGAPGSWGGHAIPIVGYGPDGTPKQGTEIITWGSVYDMTWGFSDTYVDEAYAVLSHDWIDAQGKSPSNFDLAQLQADLAAL